MQRRQLKPSGSKSSVGLPIVYYNCALVKAEDSGDDRYCYYDCKGNQKGQLAKPKRLDNGLYAFRHDTGFDRVVLDCVT